LERLRTVGAALSAAVGAPVALAGLALRPAWRVGWRERLGRWPDAPALSDAPLWIHAASAGEVLAASALAAHWQAEGRPVVASATSATGRALWASRLPDLRSGLAPLDHPWCVDRALDALGPRALVLVETELWPVWIAAAARRGIPVVMVSARLSPRAFARYRRMRFFWRRTFARIAAVGAASEDDARRFAEMGVAPDRLSVVGDLKLDLARDAGPPADDLREALATGPVWVAGSTHPGEERAVADALERVEAEGQSLRTVIAPRHLERLDAVEREFASRGRKVRRRSRLSQGPLAAGEVLLVDTMGELASLYALADVAFVGGSLAPVGGHNLLEPVAAGVPVLHGPHVEKVASSVGWLGKAGAACAVPDADALGRTLLRWLRDPDPAREAALGAREQLARDAGSVVRSAALVEMVLRGDPAARPEPVDPGTASAAERDR
jgi:3-deoxy-D-manno-octulosonic-acid transferase